MESVHNYNISLGIMLPRKNQRQDETGPFRRIVIHLQSGAEEVPFFITPSGPRIEYGQIASWTQQTDAHQLLDVLSTMYCLYLRIKSSAHNSPITIAFH